MYSHDDGEVQFEDKQTWTCCRQTRVQCWCPGCFFAGALGWSVDISHAVSVLGAVLLVPLILLGSINTCREDVELVVRLCITILRLVSTPSAVSGRQLIY